MSFLLDTSVASEPLRKTPDATVIEWIGRQPIETLFLSAVTLAEVRFGINLLVPGRRREALDGWFADVSAALGDRLLPIDLDVATTWGDLRAKAGTVGRQMPEMDAFIAATAQVHGLTVATRNVRDFEVWGGPVFDPWTR